MTNHDVLKCSRCGIMSNEIPPPDDGVLYLQPDIHIFPQDDGSLLCRSCSRMRQGEEASKRFNVKWW